MMELTKQILENHRACSQRIEWYTSNGEPDSVEETIEKLLSSDEREKFGWSNWLLSRVLPPDDKIRYAIFAAELVLDIFEKEYPDDKRPRNAIESAREYLLNKDVAAARVAAREAEEAADDATCVAACVDYVAARAADAARAVDAACAACGDYADYAACAAACAVIYTIRAVCEADYTTYTKIINYGLSLVKKCDDRCCETRYNIY